MLQPAGAHLEELAFLHTMAHVLGERHSQDPHTPGNGMIARLGHDRQWRDMGQTARLDLILVVLRADAETEGGLEKLAAMRDALLPQDD